MARPAKVSTTASALEEKTTQARALIRKDPDAFIQTQLVVPDVTGKIVPFRYMRGQQRAATLQIDAYKHGDPFRGFFLKSRQVGLTTQTVNRNFIKCLSIDNRKAATIAHKELRAKEILGKVKSTYNKLRPELKLPLSKDAENAIAFAETGSKMWIVSGHTMSSIDLVRGDTLQDAHLSEWTRFGNPKHALQEVSQVCHWKAGSSIIIETTGHMIGSFPHQFYEECKSGKMRGWHAEFLAWQDEPSTQMGFDGVHWMDWSDFELQQRMDEIAQDIPDLLERGLEHNLTPGNIAWSYDIFVRICLRDWQLFLEDYPCTEKEAWQSKGDPYFNMQEVAFLSQNIDGIPYIVKGVKYSHLEHGFKDFNELPELNQDTNVALLQFSTTPRLTVWKAPSSNSQYVMAMRGSAGTEHSEPSSLFIINANTGEMMCEFHGICRPFQLARFANSLGRFYNSALAVPEVSTSAGIAVLNELKRLHYPRWYMDRRLDDLVEKRSNKIGWVTSARNYELILSYLTRVLEESSFGNKKLIRSKGLLNELRTFVHDYQTGMPHAYENCWDTRIFTLATAWMVAALESNGRVMDGFRTRDGQVDEKESELILTPRMSVSDSLDLLAQVYGIKPAAKGFF